MNQNNQHHRQIAPGITLIKYIPSQATNKNIYIFEVEVQRLNVVEFECDFTGSENIVIKDTSDLQCFKTIQPFKRSVVAILELHKHWKLKSKFKLTLKSPSKEMQYKWIDTENNIIKSQIINTESIFQGTESSLMSIEQINTLVDKANTKYIDIDFIPNEASIINKGNRNLKDSTVTQWRRPEKFLKSPYEVITQIRPNNLVTGKMDDETFSSVLRNLSTRPHLIERLFVQPIQINHSGVYRLRICKNGEWHIVTIDDLIPCEPMNQPKFTYSTINDFWPMLIEKAYAKLHRNYCSILQLGVKDIFEDLTGCPTNIIPIEDTQLFRENISQAFSFNFIVCFYNTNQIKEFQEDEFTPISKRAYPLIKIQEGLKQISILSENGQMPLRFAELKQKFSYACICETKNWEEIRIKGKFINVQHPFDPNYKLPMSRWYYTFDLQLHTDLQLTLHQQDIHIGCNKQFKPYLWTSLVVFKKTSQSQLKTVYVLPFSNSRQIRIILDLEVGSYVVVPITLTDLWPTDKMDQEQLISDIFRKLDLSMNKELKYAELQPFFKAVKYPFNHEQYLQIIKKYSKSKSLGPNGFVSMWKDNRTTWLPEITEFSESRLFILSIHCTHELSVIVKDSIGTDFDNLAHIQIINKYGKEKQQGKQAKIWYLKHSQQFDLFSNSYISYFIENSHFSKIDIELDCSTSTGYIFNPPNGKAMRQLDPGQKEYVMKLIPNLNEEDQNFVQNEIVNIKTLV